MVTTVTVWDKDGYATDPNIQTAKQAWVQEAITSGKTTPEFTKINNLTSSKNWTDDAAADEWAAFITSLAAANGYTVTVTKI